MSCSARPYLEIRSMIAPMPYTRRPTGPNTDREDYVIRCEGRDVGRVYRRRLPEGHRYYWTIYISNHVPQVPGVPISGLAVTLDEASAAFMRAYDAMRERAGLQRQCSKAIDGVISCDG
jgi:hypothetical protein